jgi:preprotein translocase subunit SecG
MGLSSIPFTLILLMNSIVLIGLILNQNESTKDSLMSQTARSSVNPLERLTWISLLFQLILLVIKIKVTDN